MRIKIEESKDKEKDIFEWHRWFAWFPVKCDSWDVMTDDHYFIWLEWVERKRVFSSFGIPKGWWEYSAIRKKVILAVDKT